MIAFLVGKVAVKAEGYALLEVSGVGYRLNMSTSSIAALPAVGDEVLVYTHMHVREDEISLFGFESEAEQSTFERLITVSGIGPKVALSVLSSMSAQAVAAAVAAEDVAALSAVPGIGKKTAQRMILDLKGKLSGMGSTPDATAGSLSEATQALLGMGISSAEAEAALKGYQGESADVEALIKHALKRIGGGL